ncbi:MAG TPA: outer membrane beta-barrel protein [Blastocatellia bacterium]|jgi:opacity protein-like surface antigen|nr:outer membrane beta-barrel protein [Blastocatellia bacterium]
MKKVLWLIGVALLSSFSAVAQETPKSEVFGGYSYFHSDGGGSLHGWNGSAGVNLNKWLGVVADFSGHYGSSSTSVSTAVIGLPGLSVEASADSNIHTFLVGPQVSYRKDDRLTPFGHALLGLSRVHERGTATTTVPLLGTTTFNFNDTDTGFAMGLGGGLDVKMTRSVALRLIQADYLMTRLNGNNQNNARISVGFVFRFGAR